MFGNALGGFWEGNAYLASTSERVLGGWIAVHVFLHV